MPQQYHCEKCNRMLNDTQFYTYKDGTKVEMCKGCLTMHIDNYDPETYLWILEKMDVPYIPSEWNVILNKALAKDPTGSKLNGTSVIGKYLSKMKLKQWNKYTWADTEKLKTEDEQHLVRQAEEQAQYEQMLKEKLDAGEINQAQYNTMVSANNNRNTAAAVPYGSVGANTPNPFEENNLIVHEEMQAMIQELTDDDKRKLALKWGRAYRPEEWIELEKFYTDMTNSFDIQDADTINTLVLICKTNLKANQALDNGLIEEFQKLSKVLEGLRKSAKFTAAQNKEEKNDFVDSVGELVAMCERDGFIPRFATDIPQDKVDFTLKDMNNYLHTLVTQDLGFGQQIEDALKKIQIQKEIAEAQENSDDGIVELEDTDYEAFQEEMARQRALDLQMQEGDEGDDE